MWHYVFSLDCSLLCNSCHARWHCSKVYSVGELGLVNNYHLYNKISGTVSCVSLQTS